MVLNGVKGTDSFWPLLQVADLSSQPDSLPLIERIRLHVQSTQGLQADRQREVVQYYQVRCCCILAVLYPVNLWSLPILMHSSNRSPKSP